MMFNKVSLVVIEVETLAYRLRNSLHGEFCATISKFRCFAFKRAGSELRFSITESDK